MVIQPGRKASPIITALRPIRERRFNHEVYLVIPEFVRTRGRRRARRGDVYPHLNYGRLEYGILRFKCDACRHEKEVARLMVPVGATPARYLPSRP